MATTIKIVRLDGIHAQSPTFSIPYTYAEYPTTPDSATIPARIGDADVVITTRVPITASTLDACPKLKFVAVLAIGYDMVDLVACKERGVKVANVPAASSKFGSFKFFSLEKKREFGSKEEESEELPSLYCAIIAFRCGVVLA